MPETNSETLTLTLPSDLEIVVTREFNAPRHLVFEAWTRPEHLVKWWGPRSLTMTVCNVDLSIGGEYRFVLRSPEGEEYGFNGIYREIVRPDRLVHTFIFEPMPEHGSVVTVTFEESEGRTKVTETTLHATREGRDGHLQSGMEEGMRETYDRLDDLLASLPQ